MKDQGDQSQDPATTDSVSKSGRLSHRRFLQLVGAGVAGVVFGGWGSESGPGATEARIPDALHNVLDYGAVGDGAADDRSAIQSAIEAAEAGDTVYLPAGTYRVTSWEDDPYWGSSLVIDGNKEGVPLTIEGYGPETVIQYGDTETDERASILSIVPGNADDGKLDVTLRNLVLDGNLFDEDVGPSRGIAINPAHNRGDVQTPTEGHDIHLEDVEVRSTTSTGVNIAGGGFRPTEYVGGSGDMVFAGVETVTMRRVTVDTTWAQHGIGISSVTREYDEESEIGVVLEDVKVLNVNASGGDNPSNCFNISGSCLIDGFWAADGNGAGGKVSNDGIHPILRNGTFSGFNNLDRGNYIWYETTGYDDSNDEPWSMRINNVRFVDSDLGGLRLAGSGDGAWEIGEIELIRINGSEEMRAIAAVGSDATNTIDVLHLCNLTDGLESWSDGQGYVGVLNHLNVDGSLADDGWAVAETSEQSCPGLDVPGENEVGAFSRGA